MLWGTGAAAPHTMLWGGVLCPGMPWGTGVSPTDPIVGRGPVPGNTMRHRGLSLRTHCGEGSVARGCHGAQGLTPTGPTVWRGPVPAGAVGYKGQGTCCPRDLQPHGNTSPTSTWSHWGSIPMDPQPEQGLPQGRVGLTLILELSAGSFGMRGEPWAALHCQPPTVPWSSTAEPPCC